MGVATKNTRIVSNELPVINESACPKVAQNKRSKVKFTGGVLEKLPKEAESIDIT